MKGQLIEGSQGLWVWNVPVDINAIETIGHHECDCVVGEPLTVRFVLGDFCKDWLCIRMIVGECLTTDSDPDLNWITKARFHRLDGCNCLEKTLGGLRVHGGDLEGFWIDIGKCEVDMGDRVDGDLRRLEAMTFSPSTPIRYETLTVPTGWLNRVYLPSFVVCDDLFTDRSSAFASWDLGSTTVALALPSTKVFGSSTKAESDKECQNR